MRTRPVALVVAAFLPSLLLPCVGPCWGAEKVWAFAVVTDPEPHTAPADKKAVAPFTDDLRYLKDTFVTKATPERPRPELVIVPGDIAPIDVTARAFKEVLGEEMPWLPVPGNHDQSRSEASQMSSILAGYEKLGLKWGPAGPSGLQYCFTYRNALFVGLNIYWNGKLAAGSEIAGSRLTEEGLKWVKSTLAGSAARYKIVYGHRPAWPLGSRHPKDALATSPELRDRFWKALAEGGCQLYLCGHTHNYSTIKIEGVWQLDVGHARGTADTGAPSTFVKITVWKKGAVSYQTYRQNLSSGTYESADGGIW